MEPTLTLTEEQIAFFHQNGFLAVEAITTPDEIHRLREAYDKIFARKAGREEGNQFDLAGADEEGKEAALPQILNPRKYAPELAGTLYEANVVAATKQLLGTEAKYNGDHAILKPARSGAATPWHQDEAYWDPMWEYLGTLSAWMPLQDVNAENGCMQFIPGSHQWEVHPHRPIGGDVRVHGLELDDPSVDLSQAVICPLPAGGATFHLSRTLHYTGPNLSDSPRRAYIIGASIPARPRADARRFPWNEAKQTAREARAKAAQGSA